MKKFLKFIASLKLAVIVIVSLAALIATGTFVEAEYDAEAAAKLVYKTPWMFLVMGLLAVNLAGVMFDRWPWKRRHIPFLLAHIGILTLLTGSLITMFWGLDGSMSFEIGKSNRYVQVPITDFTIWSSFDGDRYAKIFTKEVDFFTNRPPKKPFNTKLLEGDLQVIDYMPYAIPSKIVEASQLNADSGPGLRFQIHGSRATETEWLVQRKNLEVVTYNFGPAQIHLGALPPSDTGKNEVYLKATNKGLEYALYYKDPLKKTKKGILAEGDMIPTGWMDFELRILRFLPHAEEKWEFKKLDKPTPLTTSAIKVKFLDKESWLAQNDVVKLFAPSGVYIVSYGLRRIELDFDIFLKKFEMQTYQGTNRAASYQSLVEVPADQALRLPAKEVLISMNEPMKHRGLTFYQASFQNGPNGNPVASILSVNYDPGRWVKYLGSLIISLGIIWLFYDKRKSASAAVRNKK